MKNLPPLPLSVSSTRPDLEPGSGHVYIHDANGRKVASLWGKPEEKIAIANLIIDAAQKIGMDHND